jgi:hypothetical protein
MTATCLHTNSHPALQITRVCAPPADPLASLSLFLFLFLSLSLSVSASLSFCVFSGVMLSRGTMYMRVASPANLERNGGGGKGGQNSPGTEGPYPTSYPSLGGALLCSPLTRQNQVAPSLMPQGTCSSIPSAVSFLGSVSIWHAWHEHIAPVEDRAIGKKNTTVFMRRAPV